MMTEIALNVLDVAQNSVRAQANLISIRVLADTKKDLMDIVIEDNGCGMTKEQIAHVTDPFFTTRTTRRVGLGVPFFKYSAECTGGSFEIVSKVGMVPGYRPGMCCQVLTVCRLVIWRERCTH